MTDGRGRSAGRLPKFLNWDSRGSELTNSLMGIGIAFVLIFINPDMWADSTQHATVHALDYLPAWLWALACGAFGVSGVTLLVTDHVHEKPASYLARRSLLLLWAGWWLALAALTVWVPPRGTVSTPIFFVLFLKSGLGFCQIRAMRDRG
jgi:hypothetical protein